MGEDEIKISDLDNGKKKLEYIKGYLDFNKLHKEHHGEKSHITLASQFSENVVRSALGLKETKGKDFDAEKDNSKYEIKCSSKAGNVTFSNKKPDKVVWAKVLEDKIELFEIEFLEVAKLIDEKRSSSDKIRYCIDLKKCNPKKIKTILFK